MPEGHDPAAARDALDAFEGDRSGIGSRMTAETWWGAPAQGFATALLIAGPAAGIQWAWLPFLAAALIFFGVEVYFRRRSSLTISRPAGPLGVVWLIVLGLVCVAALATNILFAYLGVSTGWLLLIALVAGVLITLIVAAYDRTYAVEVQRAR
ncbi:hypothetical protein [Gulosibacter faecalis]|uniref:Uncharacterized protein n=1 Tax=Gulosibacter faecalis TaxID=272240 RepID=A0ABW5V0Y8_9MICO|nr:hypothetical protein [Gulosibacter faecalis]